MLPSDPDAPTRKQPLSIPGPNYQPVPTDQSPLSNTVSLPSAAGSMVQPGAQPLAGNGGQGSGVGPPLSLPGPRATPSNAHSTSSGTTSSRSHLEKQNPGLMIYRSYGDYVVDPEDDDWLHDPKAADRRHRCCGFADTRGCINLLTLSLLAMGLLALFAGYPVISFLERDVLSNKGGFGLGGTNASGQVPLLPINRDLVDPDTPQEARTRMTVDGKKKMVLVFSDEFNQDGRSFYPGDDPFWQAVDLHYWSTGNYEWYSPEAVTTAGGALQITLSEAQTNNLNFRSGMLQTWNQFCFTGGYIEVSMVLPGAPDASGLWPAAWTMGNLGRAGYGATNDGMWPYTYDSCDVGTLKNQTYPTGGPIAAETTGVWVKENGPGVSYLPGQRLSRCTCDGEDHPGPKHPDGSYVGRSAPEIDIIEATASSQAGGKGHASMSAQLAPFDAYYYMKNTTADAVVYDNAAQGQLNSYHGGVYQEAASGIATVKSEAYNETNGQFDTYGFEYKPGSDQDSYITWTLGGDPVWTLHPSAIGPNPQMEIGQRLIPVEPMYIILNLGISSGFTVVQWDRLKFPATMLVDYVRVWQVEGEENVGCDPPDFPTADYIQRHSEAYWNPNLTTWTEPRPRGGYASTFPRNSMLTKCD